MKKSFLCFLLGLYFSFAGFTQEIPNSIPFAGLKLRISEKAKSVLSEQVRALTASPKYFKIKAERAESYFPIVERIFKEEGLPDEFKYLIILESAFVADAVSSSNAVGFWQFKKESAQEVGLRIDAHVDDRKHIVFSSRGAAKYLKRNNASLNNWIYTLISYNTGLGGVQQHVKSHYLGANEMEIEGDEHPYLIRYLAFRIAYENEIGKNRETATFLFEFGDAQHRTLDDVASETGIAIEQIQSYNKWLQKATIPDDKVYSVILPISYLEKENFLTRFGNKSADYKLETEDKPYEVSLPDKGKSNLVPSTNNAPIFLKWNGLLAIKAQVGDDVNKIVLQADIRKRRFLRFNDMRKFDQIYVGKVYYLESKNDKADVIFHTVQSDETLWDIAQKHGIKLRSLKRLNRIKEGEAIVPGRILYMKYQRPAEEPVKYTDPSDSPVKENPNQNSATIQKPNIKPVARLSTADSLQKVNLLSQNPDTSTYLVHIVQPGQTLFSVSRQYRNLSIDSIKSWNNFEINRLYEGQKLIVGKRSIIKREPDPMSVVIINENPVSTIDTLKYIVHEVEEGQTLFAISRIYKIPVDTIRTWNTLPDYSVKLTQKLIVGRKNQKAEQVPMPENSSEFIIHEVQQGEGLYRISKQYSVTIREIMEWNNKSEPSISVGEKLKILKK
jgi:membrane-bound lytic murein transglycosylase D